MFRPLLLSLLLAMEGSFIACGGATTVSESSADHPSADAATSSSSPSPSDAGVWLDGPSAADVEPDACDWIDTPGGLVARQCVHEVPSGGFISLDDAGNSIAIVDGKIVARYGPCPCSGPQLGANPTLCQQGGLTACVRQCGEATDLESTAASCGARGYWECPAPFVPAASCPVDSWPGGPPAACGPWVMNYDCQTMPCCSQGVWQCSAMICGD